MSTNVAYVLLHLELSLWQNCCENVSLGELYILKIRIRIYTRNGLKQKLLKAHQIAKKRQIRMDKWTQGTQCCLFLVAYKQKPCLKYKNNTCFFTLVSRYGRYNNVRALVDTNVDLYFFWNASSYSRSQILIINAPKRVMLHYSDQTTNSV